MVTDAQKRTKAKYEKAHVKQIIVRFYPTDEDEKMYEWIKSQENATAYLKALVKADMDKRR